MGRADGDRLTCNRNAPVIAKHRAPGRSSVLMPRALPQGELDHNTKGDPRGLPGPFGEQALVGLCWPHGPQLT